MHDFIIKVFDAGKLWFKSSCSKICLLGLLDHGLYKWDGRASEVTQGKLRSSSMPPFRFMKQSRHFTRESCNGERRVICSDFRILTLDSVARAASKDLQVFLGQHSFECYCFLGPVRTVVCSACSDSHKRQHKVRMRTFNFCCKNLKENTVEWVGCLLRIC